MKGSVSTPSRPDWIDPAFVFARRIWIHIERGEWSVARKLVDQAQAAHDALGEQVPIEQRSRDELLQSHIAELIGEARTVNQLERHGVHIVADLVAMSPEEFQRIDHFNARTLEKVREALGRTVLGAPTHA